MAAGSARVQIEGAKELRKALKRMGADVKDLTEINREAAETVASQARDRAPVLSGALRASIKSSATKTKGVVRAGGKAIPYAGVIHFGWPRHNIAPQPFIFDALDSRKDEVVGKYQDRIAALVERVGRETP
jgi:HK97 gp10 family phage protein